jgi:hypothetical protein
MIGAPSATIEGRVSSAHTIRRLSAIGGDIPLIANGALVVSGATPAQGHAEASAAAGALPTLLGRRAERAGPA